MAHGNGSLQECKTQRMGTSAVKYAVVLTQQCCCAHELAEAMGPPQDAQDKARKHSNMDRGGAHEVPPWLRSFWHLLAARGEGVTFLQWCSLW